MDTAAQTALAIRDCTIADLPGVQAIYADAVLHGTASFELVPPPLAEMEARWRALVSVGYPYLVAENSGEIVGYAYAGAYRTRPAYRDTVENSVYVAPWLKRSGVGRGLLSVLIARCEAAGYRQMIAVIGDSANQPSIRLHEAAGFTEIGTLRSVGWKHGRWLDSVLMQRPLDAGDVEPPDRPEQA